MVIMQKLREWMLPLAMTLGASLYLMYHSLPQLHAAGPFLEKSVGVLQPMLIFSMLFLTFCKIEPGELRPHRWHWWLLLIQGGLFTAIGAAVAVAGRHVHAGHSEWLVLAESAMLCLICPTATAAAVVTRKLGGDVAGITSYTILINMLTAVLVPLVVPFVQPVEGMDFAVAFCMIVAKIFPLLIMPCLCAWLVRYLLPKVHSALLGYSDLPFYIWAVSLTLAIAVTTKSIVHSKMGVPMLLLIAMVSLVCCVFQFAMGRFVGSRYGRRRGRHSRRITAGQSLGQKNTVFAIWMGYTFMTPETAIVGGMYSIWHNLYNSWQLARAEKNNGACEEE